MSKSKKSSTLLACACGLMAMSIASASSAQMVLTAAGIARGFSLSTFATDFQSVSGIGPLAIDYQTDGSILVSSYATGAIQRFANVDNQSSLTAPVINYPAGEFAHGIAHFGSTVYASRYGSQTVVQLNPDGSINHTVVSGLGNARDIEANFATGRLLVSCVQGLRNLDPASGLYTTLTSEEADGITLSADGSVIYGAMISGAHSGHLVGFDTTSGAIVFDSGFVGGGLDGTTLGYGTRAGFIYGNLNNGSVIEIELATLTQTLIAVGGSRGDFAASDPTGSGDMLLTQSDRVMRLSGIPSPGGIAVLGMGLLCATRRRSR